jgi:Haemolymph juvenile hormone binding protein (JHBP)
LKALIKIDGSYYSKNGVQHLKVNKVQVKISNGRMQLRFDNLFNGQKALEEVANNAINQNAKQLENGFIPQIEDKLAEKIAQLLNGFFDRASFAELFP